MTAEEVELKGLDNQLDMKVDKEGVWTTQSPVAWAIRRTRM